MPEIERPTRVEVHASDCSLSEHRVKDLDCSGDDQETSTTEEQDEGESFHTFQLPAVESKEPNPIATPPSTFVSLCARTVTGP